MLTHSNVNVINKCHYSSGKSTTLFGSEEYDRWWWGGCPEQLEEEVRLDKWRRGRGQKVIWTDLLYNEQYSSEGDKKAMNSKKHKKKSLLWITSYKPSSCPHRFIWLHYFLSIISIKPNAKSEVRRSHQGVHCLSLFWGKKGLDEQYVVRTKRTT